MRHFPLLFSMLFLFAACSINENKQIFQFSGERTWIGTDFWANRLQDWSLHENRLVCETSAPNRNVFLLTSEIQSNTYEVTVEGGIINTSLQGGAGVRLGIEGEFGDYRDNAIRGIGTDILVTTSGNLVMISGSDSTAYTTEVALDSFRMQVLASSADLEVVLTDLTTHNTESHRFPLVVKSGGLALVSSFETDNRFNREPSAWFRRLELEGFAYLEKQRFGPILFAQHTLHQGTLKMNVQLAPMEPAEVILEKEVDGSWSEVARAPVDENARTALLVVQGWGTTHDINYRVAVPYLDESGKKQTDHFEGTIRKEPREALTIAAFTGNNDLGFPNNDLLENVTKQNPDFLFFSGDQIYEGVGGYGVQRVPEDLATLDYLRKWYLFGWTFRDLMRDLPSVAIPDDHDVFHGNIWGANGIATPPGMTGTPAQDQGGYKMPPGFVNVVQQTQTAHLPAPFDPTPIEQGIGVYYTSLQYGGVSFAVIEDRKFKSAPTPLLPEAEVWNGWPQNKNYDISKSDHPDAVLLGERQHQFLNSWVEDWDDQTWMKVLLSQTIFANVATLPEEEIHDQNVPKLRILKESEYAPNDRRVTDMDSNGWPMTPRDNALRILRKAFTLHIAGDQHLGSTIQYGIDSYRDAGFAICVPSVSNVWPRRWYPPNEGLNPVDPRFAYTGDYEDGFGNKMTVYAVSNPVYTGREPSRLYDRATGYGIIKLYHTSRDIILENWPRDADPTRDGKPYPGWPVRINQFDNYSRTPAGYLPLVEVQGLETPLIRVKNEGNNNLEYMVRLKGTSYLPPVFASGAYTISVGNSSEEMQHFHELEITQGDTLLVTF